MGLAAERLSEPVVLQYRPHVRWMYKAGMVVGWLLLAVALALGAYAASRGSNAIMASAGVTLFFALEFLLLSYFLMRPLALCRVEVRPDGFTTHRVNKRIDVSYADVTSLKFSALAYTGGWFALKFKSGKGLKFTVVLERSDLLLDAVYQARPDLCSAKKFHAYRRTAVFADQSWSRLYERGRQWFRLSFKYVLFPLACGAAAGACLTMKWDEKAAGGVALLVAGLPLYYGIALFMIAEYWMAWHLKGVLTRDPGAIRRDIAYERKIQRVAGLLYYLPILGVTVAAVVFAFL